MKTVPPTRRRVLLVEDHPTTRYGLVSLIGGEPDLEVCGEAGTAKAALGLLQKCAPDLLLADLGLPTRSGLDFIKDVHALHPDLPVLVLSMHDERLYAERSIRAGARGYIMKDIAPRNIIDALNTVMNGELYLKNETMKTLVDKLLTRTGIPIETTTDILSDREFEVFSLLVSGKSITEIANGLHLSVKTVSTHKAHVLRKLNLGNVSELMRYAIRHQLVAP